MRLKGSPRALLIGRIFDDVGNRMTPSHSNKRGIRYRYYVSHVPLIQGRKREAGSVTAFPQPRSKTFVLQAVRQNLSTHNPDAPSDQEAIIAQIDKIVVRRDALEIKLLETETELTNNIPGTRKTKESPSASSNAISIPWTAKVFSAVKGIVHAPDPTNALPR